MAGFAPPGAEQDAVRTDFLIVAGGLFVILALLSIVYNNMRPYRELRVEKEAELPSSERPTEIIRRLSDASEAATVGAQLKWYVVMIRLEKRIYGQPRHPWRERRIPWRIQSLQEGFDRERSGLVVVQALFALVIFFLVLARVT